MYAICSFLGTWPMPKGVHKFAVGSEGACDVVGFFTGVGFMLSPLYNCSLATYYLVELKYMWNEERMQSFEKWLHLVPWVVSATCPFIALSTESLGINGFLCG